MRFLHGRLRTPSHLHWIYALSLALLLAGCAVASNTTGGMVPKSFDVASRHSGSVRVVVTGGCDDCGLAQIKVSNAGLSDAVVTAITASGVFSRAAPRGDADYVLSINIFSTDAPVFGATMHGAMETGWTLTNANGQTRIWQQAIASEYAATMSDTLIGVERARFASEGAVRENIRQGIDKLSRVPLPSPK
jgi:hypothetical protein